MAKYRFDEIAINCTEKKIPDEMDRLNYIGLEHLDPGCIHVSRWGSDVPLKGEKLVMHKGDILFGKRNAYLRRAAISPHDGLFSAHGMVLRPRTDVIDPEFFPLFIASDYFFDEAIRISVGSLSPTVNWKDIRKLEFELPDLEEQHELAKILWPIDNTIEAYKKLIKATDALVKSQFNEMFGDPIHNSHGYFISTLKEVALGSLSYGSTSASTNYDGETRYIRITDIGDDGNLGNDIKSANKYEDKYLLNDGDILFARTGATVGKTLRYRIDFGKAIYAGYLIRLTPNKSVINPDYLYHFTRSDFYWDLVKDIQKVVAQPNINAQEYGDMKILLPPMDLQNQFADFVLQSERSKFELQRTMEELKETYKCILAERLG